MNRKRGFLPLVGLGFFAVVAQTLLFRDVVAVFEYNELSIGVFYASWLAWVSLGAWVGRQDGPLLRWVAAWFSPAVLAYIPVFLLQHGLVINARRMAGIQAYDVFPLTSMLTLLFLVNAPVSVLTGFLFPAGCRWAERDSSLPVARVYAFETLGACLGGLFVTGLLLGRVSGQVVFAWMCLIAFLVLPFGAGFGRGARRVYPFWLAFLVVVVLAGMGDVPGRLGTRWTEAEDRAAWTRLLPVDAYIGSISTSRARYLYGAWEEQIIVVSGGGVCESFPGGEHAAEVAALHLAQKPDAREILVFGADTLGVCKAFCSIPDVIRVTWLHPDPEYPEALSGILTGRLPGKLEVVSADMRAFIRETSRRYDLVVLCLPDVTTLALNRYCTREFFRDIGGILSEKGMVSVRVSGGANYVGAELADPGAVMLATLRGCFSKIAIKPGDETWLIASNDNGPDPSAEMLSKGYSGIEGASALYPPEGILALYPADRVAFQRNAYEKALADAPAGTLVNRDNSPKALKFGLFLALKQAGWRTLSRVLRYVLQAGIWLFLGPVLIYGLVRSVYVFKSRGSDFSLFDNYFLMWSTGLASMAFGIVLMFVYQARFGSLFLEIGMVTALFMLGSTLGCATVAWLLRNRTKIPVRCVSGICLLLQTILLAVIALYPEGPKCFWLGLFVLGGIFTGVYFPIAAKRISEAGIGTGRTGAILELCDTLGGAIGASVTGLLLLPLAGVSITIALLAGLVALNIMALLAPERKTVAVGDGFTRISRPSGYTLAGIAFYALLVSQLAANVQASKEEQNLESTARLLAGTAEMRKETVTREDGTAAEYLTVAPEADDPGGYVFDSRDWTSRINGYGGPLRLLVYTGPDGVLRNYEIVQHHETPAYLSMAETGKLSRLGCNLFEPNPFMGVDAVSGATVTSEAIERILEEAGRGFARQALGREIAGYDSLSSGSWKFWNTGVRDFILLSLMVSAAIALRFWPGVWMRRILLAFSLIVGGMLLNLQYSMQHVVMLAGMNPGNIGLTGGFFLAAIIPLVVLFFGNVYCGYLCPFGALQEFLGDLVPGGRHIPEKRIWRYGRAVKYVFLFSLLVLYACARDGSLLRGDILITIFGSARERLIVLLAVIVLALSTLSPRFWCRNLCPAGAFLSLINGIRLLRRWMPPSYPGRCHLGVNTRTELDCIHCDRCLNPLAKVSARPEAGEAWRLNIVFLLCVLLVFVGVFALSATSVGNWFLDMQKQEMPAGVGKPRDIDTLLFKRKMQEGSLSDHEADFYTRK